MASDLTANVLPTYARFDLTLTRGEGVWLYDAKGKRYLDFMGEDAARKIAPTVTTTSAPARVASRIPAVPTPLEPPCSSTVSPAVRPAFSNALFAASAPR